jgi:hypothetical protein
MKNRSSNAKGSDQALSNAQNYDAGGSKSELPLDLDELFWIAIFDSVLRIKRRKFRNRGGSRRPK